MAITPAVLLASACGSAPSRQTTSTTSLIERAEAAEAERRYDRARTLYQQAKREAPDVESRALAARSFGRALIFWGDYELADRQLEEAATLVPTDPGTWHDLGILRGHRGDVAGAESAFRRSIAVRPGDPRSRIALAALLWRHQRHRKALHEYRALAAIDLPGHLRDQVNWAIQTLQARLEE
ncbi:MAG: tetratricopeptide repeat protein [Proteobacteria bacterium]|nr:tetratricopeptide repeat protein [Pseudomonadota bacterium]